MADKNYAKWVSLGLAGLIMAYAFWRTVNQQENKQEEQKGKANLI